MASAREIRQIAGAMVAYLSNDLLRRAQSADGRQSQGQRWGSIVLLRVLLLGMAAGATGLRDVEKITGKLKKGARRSLGISRRVPDTTLRYFLTLLEPELLVQLLHVTGYDAMRRKSLRPNSDLPFHAISFDAKYPSFDPIEDSEYLQIKHNDAGDATHGLLRTTTATLVTAQGRPILGCTPIPKDTNEVGHFHQAFGDAVRVYGSLFKVAMYDAGGISKSNADMVVKAGKHYVFHMANETWVAWQTSEMLLRHQPPCHTEEVIHDKTERTVREVSLFRNPAAKNDTIFWSHTRTIVKVVNTTYEKNVEKSKRTRIFVSSMEKDSLTPAQWHSLIVLRWGVETSHQYLDSTFLEDKHPWIEKDPKAALCLEILRRVIYTILTLYRSVTLKNEDKRSMPFCDLLEWIYDMLIWPNDAEFANLRPRSYQVSKALA